MAQISDERKKIESAFMKDFWDLRKAVATPESRQEYWNDVVDRTTAIWNKYDHDPYLSALILTMVDDIEARSKNKNMEQMTLNLVNRMRKKRGLPEVK